MKHILFLSLLFLANAGGRAQIGVGDIYPAKANEKAGSLDKALLEKLKASTTLFVVRAIDKDQLSTLEKAIKQVWYLNTLKVIISDELSKYERQNGYSYITVSSFYSEENRINVSTHLSYWMPEQKGKGKTRIHYFARIELLPDAKTSNSLGNLKSSEADKEVSRIVNQEAKFYNLTPAFLTCYLHFIQNRLNAGEPHYFGQDESDPKLLKQLALDTLFIPKFLENYGFSEKMLVNYKFPYKILDDASLTARAMDPHRKMCLLSFARIRGPWEYFTLFDLQSGAIIYSMGDSEALTEKNFSRLFNKIAKTLRTD